MQILSPGARVISRLVLVLSVVVLGLSSLVGAQELGATLTGSVSDPSGALVPNATVLVHSEDTNADTRTVVTNSSGDFNITNLPAGRYSVTVNIAGFQTYVASNVILNVAEKRSLDVQLKAGQVSERVEVTARMLPSRRRQPSNPAL